MLRSSAQVDQLLQSPVIDSGASVTKVGGKHRHQQPDVTADPTPILQLPDPSEGSTGGSPSPTPSSDDDPLTQLGNALTGTGGSQTGASNDDDDLLTGVLDDVSTLLDPDGDGTLGGAPGKGGSIK